MVDQIYTAYRRRYDDLIRHPRSLFTPWAILTRCIALGFVTSLIFLTSP
ncbi:MAG: hypothetical protein KDA66_17210 [Planctomycetaceae bacterium]|nr:hypothetical protein [Planctomycetaceae bacterium]